MTMITCVITVIVHTITGWVSNCLSRISCSTCVCTHSSRCCKYSAAQSIPTSALSTEMIQRGLCLWQYVSGIEKHMFMLRWGEQ